MKINQFYTSFLLLLSMFLFSCENETIKPIKNDISFSITKNTVYLGDTLIVFGLDEIIDPHLNLVIRDSSDIDSVISIQSSDLKLINLNLNGRYTLFIENGIDTSGGINVDFYNYPNFRTVIIPAGTYTNGYIWGLPDENTEKEVNISHSLEVMVYELSEAEFNYVLMDSRFNYNGRKPIAGIGWDDAINFCMEINLRMGFDSPFTFTDAIDLDISKNGWRLPTEAEWEYLCKADSEQQVPAPNLNDIAWFVENSGSNIFDRGLKQANPFGLYDMLGNVAEWCWDLYDENYYEYGSSTDPEGPIRWDDNRPPTWIPVYVKRGGSVNTPTSRCRASFRMSTENDPNTIGVRLVRTIQ